MKDWKNKIKAEMDFHPRKILDSDVCDWCQKKKAVITDGRYIYCSEDCKKLFIDDAYDAIAHER